MKKMTSANMGNATRIANVRLALGKRKQSAPLKFSSPPLSGKRAAK
jgi:hypothetical protein